VEEQIRTAKKRHDEAVSAIGGVGREKERLNRPQQRARIVKRGKM
jgi:hypothetical protein